MNFFAYRKPGETEVKAGCSHNLVKGFCNHSFIVAPFADGYDRAYSIPVEQEIHIGRLDELLSRARIKEGLSDERHKSTEKIEHTALIESIREAIQKGKLKKCVASRILVCEGRVNLSRTFLNLCESYPDAFVFVFHTPESGTWMGASPELLLSAHESCVKSMSLAGTRQAGTDDVWRDKDIREQEIVTEHIVKEFNSYGLCARTDGPVTRQAGPVEHLMSEIHADLPAGHDAVRLLKTLQPTPALCGEPLKDAMMHISEHEKFSRGYYGGFCGWFESSSDFDFYVNLRSFKILENSYNVFVGGGILEESDPDEEWAETEHKAKTVLSKILLK